jgi:phosphoribosylformylglycinamidine cyclo-ligase
MSDAYLEQVVNLGDDASKMLFRACKATWDVREGKYGEVIADEENFRGWRHWSILPLLEVPEPEGLIFDQQGDGIGTKVIVSQGTSSYRGGGMDLTAMAADDAAAKGLEPIIMTTGLNVNKFTDRNKPYAEQLAQGGIAASRRARLALYGGETAVLGNLVGGRGNPNINLHFIWEGTVHAVGHEKRQIDGSKVRPGMAVVGLQEPGLRSNGITKARDTLKEAHGNYWFRKKFETEQGVTTLGEAVVQGSVIYTPVLMDATGGYDLRVKSRAAVEGAAHITGGGVVKLLEMLAVSGYGADIEDPHATPEIMKEILRLGKVPDKVAYKTVHMGSGMMVVTSQPDKFIDVAHDNDVEAKVIGTITKKPGVVIRSAGVTAPGRKLKFAA